MSRTNPLQDLYREQSVSLHCPYTHLVSSTVFECQNGQLGSVIAVEGVPFDTEQENVLAQYKQVWHDAVSQLDDNYGIYTTLIRQKHDITLTGEFKNKFLQDFDDDYHAQFKNKAFYKNVLYITIVIKGVTEANNKGLNFLDKIIKFTQKTNERIVKEARNTRRQQELRNLNNKVNQIITSLSLFRPRLLGLNDEALQKSELLTFLGQLINAGTNVNFKMPPALFSHELGFTKNKKYPEMVLSQYLAATSIYFGEQILFKSADGNQKRFGAVLTIKNYPGVTSPYITDKLLACDTELIITNVFFPIAKNNASQMVKKQYNRLTAMGDEAQTQIESLALLSDAIASETASLGQHQMMVLLLADSKESLEIAVYDVIKRLQDADIIAVRETLGMMPAYWAMLPGNQQYLARLSSISSWNFVDFTPLHNYRLGYKDGNFLGSAVTILTTPSKTPYFFNFHTKGSKENPSKGHWIMVGGNDSGKTAAIGALDAQFSRYHGRSIFFDRDRGLELYVRASGGYYAVLSPAYAKNCQFNPLQLEDTSVNRQYCREWLALLLKRENESLIPASVQKWVEQCITYAFDDLDKQHRLLSNITNILPIDFERWDELKRWLGKYQGKYAYLFDNDKDVFTYYDKMGFDLTHFLSREPKPVLAALVHYLFYRIELALDGRPTHCVFDEGWQILQEKTLRDRLETHLPTGRKKSLFIGIATQSTQTIVDNPISHTILDNIATGIYFVNNNGKSQHYCDVLGLTDSEFNFIKEGNPTKRLMLVKQERDSTICQLNLAGLDDALAVFSANEKTIRLAESIMKEVGQDPKAWLPVFHERRKQHA